MALTNHILSDSPTNNFATLNPLNLRGATLYDGSLKISGGGNNTGSFATIPIQKTDKWYIEVRTNDTTTDTALFLKPSKYFSLSTQDEEETIAIFSYSTDISIRERTSPTSYTELGVVTGQSRTTTGDVLGYLFDLENNTITVYKNGVHKLTVTNVTPVDDVYFVGYNVDSTWGAVNMTFNFGQDPTFAGDESPTTTYTDASRIGAFYYQPPTGALALCTANLPDFTPTVTDDTPQDYFKAVIWTGQTNAGAYNNGNVTVGFQPDLVWIKARETGYAQLFNDSLRGTGVELRGNEAGAQVTRRDGFTAFNTTGFSVGTNAAYNDSAKGMVAWNWKAGGAPTADNTATSGAMTVNSVSLNGTLQSNYTPAGSPTIYPKRMSINTYAGFSIVKYIGTGANATVPHGLDKAPEFVVIKNIDKSAFWPVWHKGLGQDDYLRFNETTSIEVYTGAWNSTIPNNSVVSLGDSNILNEGTVGQNQHIMYCWHSVEGYSKFGSYTGNSSADGPFVDCGFRPAWLMIKNSTTTSSTLSSWGIYDNSRAPYNQMSNLLWANKAAAEGYRGDGSSTNSLVGPLDFLSNGFKVRSTACDEFNTSATYIFMAFAEQPFKFSNAR